MAKSNEGGSPSASQAETKTAGHLPKPVADIFASFTRWRHSAASRIFVIALVVLLPMTALLFGLLAWNSHDLRQRVAAAMDRYAGLLQRLHEAELQVAEEGLRTLIDSLPADMDEQRCTRVFRSIAEQVTSIAHIGMIDRATGRSCSDRAIKIDAEIPAQLLESLADGETAIHVADLSDDGTRPIAIYVRDGDRFFFQHMNADWLHQIRTQGLFPDYAPVTMLTEDARVIASSMPAILPGLSAPEPGMFRDRALSQDRFSAWVRFRGVDYAVSTRRTELPGGQAIYYVIGSTADWIDPNATRDRRIVFVAVIALVLLALIATTILADRLIARPIARLRDEASGLLRESEPNLIRLPGSASEFQDLAQSIEHCAGVLALRRARMEAALASAERANRRKNEFLAHLSHELRTPLNAVIGFSDMISNAALGPLPEPYRAYGTDIKNSGGYLLSLIDNLLSLAAIEERETTLSPEEFDLVEFLEETVDQVTPAFREAKIDLVLRRPKQAVIISADRQLLRQALLNLLSNALRYSDRGSSVTMRVAMGADRIAICIADRGHGMSQETINAALSAFSRLDNPYVTNKKGNMGLGLPIAAGIVKLHGGELQIDSKIDDGTEVRILLPPDRWRNAPAGESQVA